MREEMIMKMHVAVLAAATLLAAGQAPAADKLATGNPYLENVPISAGPVTLPITPANRATRPYEMSPVIPPAKKEEMMQELMPMMNMATHMNVKDVLNLMATKYKAKPGLSFDDVVESMKLRANQLNLKLVGTSPMWKDFRAVLGDKNAPRVEVFHYCDIAVAREVLKYAPEAIVFLPCRIDVMEDADHNIWVLTLDWNVAWLNSIAGKMGMNADPVLVKDAQRIRSEIDNVMRAAANGDL
jgi:uncharacterized protein (DUF302 family)